jgi:hypothetical protein
VDATGYSNVYQGGELVQSGTAGGPPVDLDLDTSDSFTPQVQLGYFDHFTDSKWMWGGKFNYNYLNASSTKDRFLIPQFGSYGDTEFTGNAVVRSMEVSLTNQFSIIRYIGKVSAVSTHGTVWPNCVVEGLWLILTPVGVKDDEKTRDDEGPCRAGREGYPACDAQVAFVRGEDPDRAIRPSW